MWKRADRDLQIQPSLLFVTNGVVYGAAPRPLLPMLPTLLSSLTKPPKQVVIISHLPPSLLPPTDLSLTVQTTAWEDFLVPGEPEQEVEFLRMGFNEPIWILFSSGTTGDLTPQRLSKHR